MPCGTPASKGVADEEETMSDDMKPDLQTWIEPELEARVVAWVLGEASAFEAAELERIIAEKPELGIFKRRIEVLHGLVASAVRPEIPARLSSERRRKLLEIFGKVEGAATTAPVAISQKSSPSKLHVSRRVVLGIAACVALFVIAALTMPVFQSVQQKASRSREFDMVDAGEEQSALEEPSSPVVPKRRALGWMAEEEIESPAAPVAENRNAPAGDLPNAGPVNAPNQTVVAGGSFGLGSGGGGGAGVSAPAAPALAAQLATPQFTPPPVANGQEIDDFDGFINYGSPIPSTLAERRQRDAAFSDDASQIESEAKLADASQRDFNERGLRLFGAAPAGEAAKRSDAAVDQMESSQANEERMAKLEATTTETLAKKSVDKLAAADVRGKDSEIPHAAPRDVLVTKEYDAPSGLFGRTIVIAGTSSVTRSSSKEFLEQQGVTFPTGAAVHYLPESGKLVVRNTRENLDLVDAIVSTSEAAPAKQKLLEAIASDEIAAAQQPFSTFSLHVADVSFRLAQAALAKGEMPDREIIRPEEFYNVFDYGDPAPANDEKVSCHIEQTAHPVLQQRNFVRIAMKVSASGRGKNQPLRLTVLLDTSGSMEREDRAASVRRAMEVLASLLGPNDAVTLIGFSRQPRLLAENVPGDQGAKLADTVARTPSEGGTNLEEALKLASQLARRHRLASAQNRVVLLTDGAANLGNANPAQLATMIEKLRQQGIAFDACGVGAEGLNDDILEALTRKGDGRYYFLNRPEDADTGFASQLAGAFRPAGQNAKVQVRFNPARVGNYRLIGFEKHRLKKEDFRNDKVDAAELAAEEAAVALYQVETLPEGEGELGEVFVRFRDAADGRMVEQSWTMSYEPRARAFDQASPSMQLAGVSALLAEKLHGGAMANLVDLDSLTPVVTGLRGHYPHQARVQELVTMFEQMRRMAK
jgi:Ca-activated chloride channel homolog